MRVRGFGELEAVVMDRIWDRDGTTTVREIFDELAAEREIAYTTVMSTMDNLHTKGWLERERDGKAYRYWPALTREQHSAQLMREVFDAGGALNWCSATFSNRSVPRNPRICVLRCSVWPDEPGASNYYRAARVLPLSHRIGLRCRRIVESHLVIAGRYGGPMSGGHMSPPAPSTTSYIVAVSRRARNHSPRGHELGWCQTTRDQTFSRRWWPLRVAVGGSHPSIAVQRRRGRAHTKRTPRCGQLPQIIGTRSITRAVIASRPPTSTGGKIHPLPHRRAHEVTRPEQTRHLLPLTGRFVPRR